MSERVTKYQGCLLGLAAGDALGAAIDKKSFADICKDYGPNGLMGYDVVNGCPDISSNTQIAAFACNGMLLALTMGSGQNRPIRYESAMALALREWAMTQRYTRIPEKTRCWLCQVPELCRHRCLDLRLPDTLSHDTLGTPEAPINQQSTPGSLLAAVAAGLVFDPERMPVGQLGLLGAQTVALTHGDPITFLCGAAVSYIIAGIVQEPDVALIDHFTFAADAVAAQFGSRWPQANELQTLIRKAVFLAASDRSCPEVLDELNCATAAGCLAGAIYAILRSGGDFDTALITAVNHSGRSAAAGALTGAILGVWLGTEGISEFYLEGLAAAPVLRQLAADLAQGGPSHLLSRLFDDDWDKKYVRGERVDLPG